MGGYLVYLSDYIWRFQSSTSTLQSTNRRQLYGRTMTSSKQVWSSSVLRRWLDDLKLVSRFTSRPNVEYRQLQIGAEGFVQRDTQRIDIYNSASAAVRTSSIVIATFAKATSLASKTGGKRSNELYRHA